MKRTAAAIAEQNVFARIDSVLDRYLLDGAGHGHRREGEDAVRHLDQAIVSAVAQRGGNAFDRLARRRDVELQLAAEKAPGVEAAEHEIGVGHGWFNASGSAGRAMRSSR